jgi:L-glyceraldehyde 3-phosphate reductase
MGAIAFTPLAQGLLTDKYLGDGTAERAQARRRCPAGRSATGPVAALRSLDVVAKERGQSSRMALQWVLRDGVVASALIGASRPRSSTRTSPRWRPRLHGEELERIDAVAGAIDVDLWAESATA